MFSQAKIIKRQGEKIFELEEQLETRIRQLYQLTEDYQDLKKVRMNAEVRNTDLSRRLKKKNDLFNEIEKLAEGNTYDNERVILSKIKELIHDDKSEK